jgi:hypothetical protein
MKNLKQKLGQALLIVLANISMSAMLVFGFLQNMIY